MSDDKVIPSEGRLNIRIHITQLSGERFWEIENPIPPQLHIAVNVNLLGVEKRSENTIKAPFVFTVNFTPSIAQINIKGNALALGEIKEIDKIVKDHNEKKTAPTKIIQAITNITIAEAIIISKTLGIPPPLPPITPSTTKIQKKSDSRYTA